MLNESGAIPVTGTGGGGAKTTAAAVPASASVNRPSDAHTVRRKKKE